MLIIYPTLLPLCAEKKWWESSNAGDGLREGLEREIYEKHSARYNRTLANRFEAWCGENEKEAYPVSYECVAGFVCSLAQERSGSTKSLAVVLTALRARVAERGEAWLGVHEATRLRIRVSWKRLLFYIWDTMCYFVRVSC